jgi:hypothetical protein
MEWADRWRLLAEEILPVLPVTVLLDNFEDNLQPAAGGGWQVRDPELAAFLAGWARRPGQSRLVFTCRYPFTLPGQSERRLAGLHLGPLSAAETRKLMWRLPGLDALPAGERDRPTATSAATPAPWNTSTRCCAAGRPVSMTSPGGWRTGSGAAASPTPPPGSPHPAGTWTPAWPRP